MLSNRERERLLTRLGGRRPRSPGMTILANISWPIVGGFLALLGVLGYILWRGDAAAVGPATLAFVVVGWVFGLCLHEFTHAATAVFGGDDSPSTQRYLSFNPLHYVHPVFSILLPLFFLLLGGIGLPGGAVYLQRDRARSPFWQSAISLSAPLANLLLAAVLALPLRFGLLDDHPALAGGIAALAFFQVMACVLNLLPIPPLDGFGAIAHFLPADIRNTAYALGNYTVLLLFVALSYLPSVSDVLYRGIFNALAQLGVDPFTVQLGLQAFFFFRQ